MTTTVFMNGRSQAVRLPKEFRVAGDRVSVRRVGDGLLLEPVKESAWPDGWFDEILITDETFTRPDQGTMPAAPEL